MQFCIILYRIMLFLDREPEQARLDQLLRAPDGGLGVVTGRRRIGKTRLLVEWCRRHHGVYAVADQSAPDVQRRHLAEAVATKLPGFADVDYRDWATLLTRLAREADRSGWRGPVVFDELPYWVGTSPELPSVLQRWIDHDAKAARLVVVMAGSSQRMMQGLVLDRQAPLFGRASEFFEVQPLDWSWIRRAAGRLTPRQTVEFWAAWGGVPRYWELAADDARDTRSALDRLVLDPSGPLHREPDRLLLEETPSALEVRPLLDAIGGGAQRVSEIAARLGRPATSLSRPLDRLLELGLVVRDVPFGEPARGTKRSLYRVSDPFTRLWFRVVAPHRGQLVSGTPASRLRVLNRFWPALVGEAWEQLSRLRLSACRHPLLGVPGDWSPAQRWWQGADPEWDVVAEHSSESRVLLGEAKLGGRLDRIVAEVKGRRPPALPARFGQHEIIRAVFVPDASRVTKVDDVAVVSLRHL
jgi:AAA+ ATPase superfamily predicted ATPase